MKNRLNLQQRRVLLLLHILFAAIMLGGQVVFIIVSLTASFTDERSVLQACYTIMHLLADTSVRASTIGATVTGILLSFLTSWGLFKYYWIIAKDVLTLLAIGVGIFGIYEWTLRGVERTSSLNQSAWDVPGFAVNHTWLWLGIAVQTISIVIMFVLSIWKPWGQRTWPQSPAHALPSHAPTHALPTRTLPSDASVWYYRFT